MVAGPRVYICDRCVLLASQIMGGDSDNGSRPAVRGASVWNRLVARARQVWDWSESRLLNA
ncbi:MAG: ClpX C4-type zinc finger protein [Candidatus Competibacteraceae bacterium]|nr:ClpX C4-type zinc finger protein [Candidatus Competibacteraceae bacterium]MBK7983432.1 ClpX C4-type zinc finger protein [Candidatus Competibacteraceae bacterium]MBK8898028.1 ClpX C4-type zinc finger protein [Candidatus Competibacteraceae bacterium]MBK8961832.1 ClpX C4-type zinc finger protein [Candidatus Competibacteraceae bacterium]MBK9951045.1 ClpX C4-type zinc finger protein [Candidatus Competibacteraceae bacterium]